MCTAVTYHAKDHYFGRNLDLDFSYHETVTVTPRNYVFKFRKAKPIEKHYAMIGMAFVVEGYPLYYDAVNEAGLGMAGLNFPTNADYKEEAEGKDNITPFEFIPWILSQCKTVEDAKKLLERINLVNIPFAKELPLSPLHWMIADEKGCIVVESVKEGLKVYDNPTGVMSNNPTFDYHLMHLNEYMNLTSLQPISRFADNIPLHTYGTGMGAIGLPGDYSSSARFVRAAFVRNHAVVENCEEENVSQFFHILKSVEQVKGVSDLGRNEKTNEEMYEVTIYSSCCNASKGIYYYTTYHNSRIHGVDMHHEDLEGNTVISYELIREEKIDLQN